MLPRCVAVILFALSVAWSAQRVEITGFAEVPLFVTSTAICRAYRVVVAFGLVVGLHSLDCLQEVGGSMIVFPTSVMPRSMPHFMPRIRQAGAYAHKTVLPAGR